MEDNNTCVLAAHAVELQGETQLYLELYNNTTGDNPSIKQNPKIFTHIELPRQYAKATEKFITDVLSWVMKAEIINQNPQD